MNENIIRPAESVLRFDLAFGVDDFRGAAGPIQASIDLCEPAALRPLCRPGTQRDVRARPEKVATALKQALESRQR
jgi:hypothetical protein